MATHDPRFRADILCADVRRQRMILRRLREEIRTLSTSAPPHLKVLLEERIDKVALELARTKDEAREAVLSLPLLAKELNRSANADGAAPDARR